MFINTNNSFRPQLGQYSTYPGFKWLHQVTPNFMLDNYFKYLSLEQANNFYGKNCEALVIATYNVPSYEEVGKLDDFMELNKRKSNQN